MNRRERDALDAALLDAHAKGLRVFCCFGCGDWFIQTGEVGRFRRACDDPFCRHIFRYWKRNGRLPPDDWKPRAPTKADTERLPVRVLFECAA